MLSERFDAALVFASALHREQKRKSTAIPYVAHLLAVASLTAEGGGGEVECIAALLHDALEDQGDSYPGGRDGLRAEIRERFGEAVLAIVEGCTSDEEHGKDRWRERKQAYIDHLAEASASVRLVSCADKLHNLRSMLTDYREQGEALWQRFRTKSRAEQFWYYGSLIDVYRRSGGRLASELEETWRAMQAEAARRDSAGPPVNA
ncbi:MAG TPA: phosphohydrolase [Solibacterales bacterium]|nr:phosphohydrolase [Bryobacterales bacterium]